MDKWSNAAMARLVELQQAEGPVGGIQVFSAAPRQIPLANMKVTTKISIDLTRPNIGTRVDAMQGDGNTRYVEASLLSGGRPWEPPEGVEIAVVYNKPDDTRGMYNKLPDDTPAVTVEGNVVTIILAPQMLTVPGIIRVGIVINNDSLDQLTTFPFDLSVARNQFAGAQISEDYIRLEWLETKLDEYLQKAADSGAFKGDPFTYEDFTPAQLAALQGPAGKSAFQYAVEGGYTGTEAEFAALVAYDSRKQIELVKDTMIRLHEGVTNDASGTVIALSDASDGPLQGLRIYGRTTQDGTPTPDNPVELVSVGDGGSISMSVSGLQILSTASRLQNGPVSSNGITATLGSDGNVVLNGKSTENVWIPVGTFAAIEGKTYTVYSALGVSISIWSESQDYYKNRNTEYFKFTSTKTERKVIVVNEVKNLSVSNFNLNAAVFYGDVENLWEPYTGQTLPISTQNGLPGIPVTSGGNYTDADGQQWVCDEVDFARGVYVQRVVMKEFDGTEHFGSITLLGDVARAPCHILNTALNGTYSGGGLYSHGSYKAGYSDNTPHAYVDNDLIWLFLNVQTTVLSDIQDYLRGQYENGTPVSVLYKLITPIETPIPADELAAYAALHTNRPNTTIYNDAGAYMDVEYVADTKLYIDQKINELATAIVSST